MTRPYSIREPNFIIVCVNPFFVVSLVGLHIAFTLFSVCSCVCVDASVQTGVGMCFSQRGKLNYPQRCVFLSGKLCTTRQERRGRVEVGTETNHKQSEREVDGL